MFTYRASIDFPPPVEISPLPSHTNSQRPATGLTVSPRFFFYQPCFKDTPFMMLFKADGCSWRIELSHCHVLRNNSILPGTETIGNFVDVLVPSWAVRVHKFLSFRAQGEFCRTLKSQVPIYIYCIYPRPDMTHLILCQLGHETPGEVLQILELPIEMGKISNNRILSDVSTETEL